MLGMTHSIINNFLNHVFHAIWFYLLAIEPRYHKRTTAWISVITAVAAEVISLASFAYFDSKQQALTVTFYVASIVYAISFIFLMQRRKWLKSLFVCFTYICIWAAVYVCVMVVTRYVLGGWQPAMWILRSLGNIGLLLAYRCFFKTRFLESQPAIEKASGVLILVSGMAYLLVPTLMIYYAYGTQTAASLAVVIFLLLFSLAWRFIC